MVNRCSLCKDREELANHILIHCDKTRELWTLLLTSFRLVWMFPASMRNLLLEWKVKGAKEEEKSNLEISSDLSFLVYLGGAKPKNFPRGRVVRSKFEESLHPITVRVVSAVFGVG